MIWHPDLIPECNVDTAFVEMPGYAEPNHASGIFQVCTILEKRNPKQKAIGFIDGDKKKPPYLANFKAIDRAKNVQLLKHEKKDQYLIVVSPAMDRFIFDLCEESGIDLANYGLPKDFKSFLAFTKKASVKTDKDFKSLLNTIKQKKPLVVEKIHSWIVKYYKA